jgi:alanine dehydrogenase
MGLKQGWFSSRNASLGLPNHAATMLIANPQTGALEAVLSANVITEMRTAAAGAIAAKYLSRPDSSHVAILGVGEQGQAQLEALQAVRSIEKVSVWSRRTEAVQQFINAHSNHNFEILGSSSAEEAVQNADIIVCTTPAKQPILQQEWVRAGTHINAIGSDAPNKQELDSSLVQHSIFFADKRSQSISIGEMQQPIAEGLISSDHIYAELGEIIAKQKTFIRNVQDITVFDSSGVSFQDLVVAGYLMNLARDT